MHARRQRLKCFKEKLEIGKSLPNSYILKEQSMDHKVQSFPTHYVMELNSVLALHQLVVLTLQNIRFCWVRTTSIQGSTTFSPLSVESTISLVQSIPILTVLASVTNNVGDVVLPTGNTSKLISPFGCQIMFANVSKFTIILVLVSASIALLSILCSHDETDLFATMIVCQKI